MWPYLEQFALEAGGEIRKELGGEKPDLIIGNYSDGNLVATLLAYYLNVTQCTIGDSAAFVHFPPSTLPSTTCVQTCMSQFYSSSARCTVFMDPPASWPPRVRAVCCCSPCSGEDKVQQRRHSLVRLPPVLNASPARGRSGCPCAFEKHSPEWALSGKERREEDSLEKSSPHAVIKARSLISSVSSDFKCDVVTCLAGTSRWQVLQVQACALCPYTGGRWTKTTTLPLSSQPT